MSMDEEVDEELKSALRVTPFVHLIPKQGLAALVNPQMLPQPVGLSVSQSTKRIDIHDPSILNLLGADLLDFTDNSSPIHFKKFPTMNKATSEVPLNTVEKQLLDLQNENQYQVLEKNYVQTPRLSIRKKYDMDDISIHNQTYERKFSKEIFKERTPSVKRSIEEPETNRKIVKFADSDLKRKATEKILELGDKECLNIEKLDVILETLKLVHKELDMEGCTKIQKLCHCYLIDSVAELNQEGLSDLSSIQSNLQKVQGCVVASSCIMWIMTNNTASKSLLVGEYIIQIAGFVFLIVNSLLMTLSTTSPADYGILDRTEMLRIISETGSLLKQIGNLNSKLSLEEESLTKLELASFQLIFEELFCKGKSLLDFYPIESLRYSAALFIIEVYKHSILQRLFLLNELVTNFSRLPVKRMEARNYQSERGNKFQLFSAIAVRISQEDGAEILALGLVDRVIEKFDSTSKLLFEFLFEDLNVMLLFPEWAASATLLKCLAEQILGTLINKEIPPAIEVYFLELLGNVSKNVLILKNSTKLTEKQEILFECSKYGSADATKYLEKCIEPHDNGRISFVHYLLRDLDKFNSMFLVSLGHFLESPKIKIKTKSVKILAMLSDHHPNLLDSPALQQSLSARLCDDATLVRDATYEFLGKYVRSNPSEADKFCNQLCNALSDEGVSVRKKAIRLSKEIYSMFGANAKSSIGARVLIRLTDEEDSIKNEALAMMMECWIIPLNNRESARAAVVGLINLAMSHNRTLANLETFLDSYVLKKPEHLISVNSLIDTLLDFVSDESGLKEGALLLISICSQCKPDLMGQDQLIALQLFLTDDANCSTKSYRFALKVLKNVLPTVISLRPDFIDPVQGFLLRKLTKFSHKELHEAVPSLWQFCKIKKDYLKMVNATISTMRMMRKYIDQRDMEQDNRLGKLLQLLSSLVCYCELEKFRDTFLNANIGLKKNEPVASLAIKYITSFCQKSNPVQIKSVAVGSLLVACTNYPRILMSVPVLSVFDQLLETDAEITRAVIQAMISFLREKDKANISGNSSLEDIVDDACPGIVQRYIGRMLCLSLSDKGEFAYLPFQFVQVALELGFANPKICISTIIALEASPVAIIQTSATKIHKELFNKHESLVDSNYQESIRLAYDNDLLSVLFFNVVHEILQTSRSSRNRFIRAICKSLALERISFLFFCIERIPLINFKSIEEIFIILLELQDHIHNSDPEGIDYLTALSLYAMIELYRHLSTIYKITDEQVESFGAGSLELDHKHAPKQIRNSTLSLKWFRENINNIDCLDQCLKNIKEFA